MPKPIEDLTPLPVVKSEPQKPEPQKPEPTKTQTTKVFINSAGCQPTPDWRKRLTLDIAEMGNLERVLKDAKLYERWDRLQGPVSEQVNAAKTVSDCAEAQAAYEKLRGQLGL